MTIHTGAMIALGIPDPENYALPQTTGNETPADELHITLAYLGEAADISPEQRDAILEACQVLADTCDAPEALFPASTGVFPPDPESPEPDPMAAYYAAPANPERFSQLRDDLCIHFASRGVGDLISTKHPVFTPHMTLTYAPLGEGPDTSNLPTPFPTKFNTLIAKFADEIHVWELGTPEEGPELPITASVQAHLRTLSERVQVSEDYLTALYLRQRQVKGTPSQTRAQAALERVTSLADPQYKGTQFSRVRALSDRISIEPDPAGKVLLASRALALASRTEAPTSPNEARELQALTASLRALIADGNSSIARSLRARMQLRDRFGRWIEEGRGVRFKIRTPGVAGGGTWWHGTVVGQDVAHGLVHVKLEANNSPEYDGKVVAIPNNKLEQPKAIIGLGTPGKVSKFVAKSFGRKGKATTPEEAKKFDFNKNTDQLDHNALSSISNLIAQTKENASKDPTGGHITALLDQPQVRNAIADATEPTATVTGNKEPFKSPVTINVADAKNIIAALDNYRDAYTPKDIDSLSEADRKKALSSAAGQAISHLGGMYNDFNHSNEAKANADAVALRKMPSIGTESALKDAIIPDHQVMPFNKKSPSQDKVVNATQDAYNHLHASIADDSFYAKARDQISKALTTANNRYTNGQDSHEQYLANLDSIKEFANAQEPSWKSPHAKDNPAQQAFGHFAEDIDNAHKAAGGVDHFTEAHQAINDALHAVESHINSRGEMPGDLNDAHNQALDMYQNMVNGGYLNNPEKLASDLQGLSHALSGSPTVQDNPDSSVHDVQGPLNDAANKLQSTPTNQTPDLNATQDYTDAPANATPDEKTAYQHIQDIYGAAYDLMANPGTTNTETQGALSNLNDALTKWDNNYAGAPEGVQKKLSADVAKAAQDAASAYTHAGGSDSTKAESLAKAGEALSPTPTTAEPSTKGLIGNTPNFQTFQGLHDQFQALRDSLPQGDPLREQFAAAGNTVFSVGKMLQQGKITPSQAADFLDNAHIDVNGLFKDAEHSDKLNGTKLGDNLDNTLTAMHNVEQHLAKGNFDSGSKNPNTPQSAPAEPSGSYESLTGDQKNSFNEADNAIHGWFSNLGDQVNYIAGHDNTSDAEGQKMLDDFNHFEHQYTQASDQFHGGHTSADQFKSAIDQAANEWQSSQTFNSLVGPDGEHADQFSPHDVFQDVTNAVTRGGNTIENTPASDPWASHVPNIDNSVNKIESNLPDSSLVDQNAPYAVDDFQKALENLKGILAPQTDTAENIKDAINSLNQYSDKLDSEHTTGDHQAFAEGEKARVKDAISSLESAAAEDNIHLDPAQALQQPNAGPVDQSHVQSIVDALKAQDGPIAKLTADYYQNKIDKNEPVTQSDINDIQKFLGTLGTSHEATPAEKAEIHNAKDVLDHKPAETAKPSTPEASKAGPNAPAAPEANAPSTASDIPAGTPANADGTHGFTGKQIVDEWNKSLNEYLNSPAYTGAHADAEMVHGSVWNKLNDAQVSNIASIIGEPNSAKALSNKDKFELQNALDAHIAGKISDDQLIQHIGNAMDNYSFHSHQAGRLRGAQSGIQVNKPALVPILRPKSEFYGDAKNLDQSDFYVASPEVMQGTINKILEQGLAGSDLESLLKAAVNKDASDAQTAQHIADAKASLNAALDAFHAGDAHSLADHMSNARDSFDKAIALRQNVHKNDKVIRRLRARRRALDEVLSGLQGKWPDKINGGTPQGSTGGYVVNNSFGLPDKNGVKVYPGDLIERTHGTTKGQTALVVATQTQNGAPRALVQLNDHPGLYANGLGNKSFVLGAVGPNNPLYHDPSYTGPKVDDGHTHGTFGNLGDLQKTYTDNQAKKGKLNVPAEPAVPTTQAPTPQAPAPSGPANPHYKNVLDQINSAKNSEDIKNLKTAINGTTFLSPNEKPQLLDAVDTKNQELNFNAVAKGIQSDNNLQHLGDYQATIEILHHDGSITQQQFDQLNKLLADRTAELESKKTSSDSTNGLYNTLLGQVHDATQPELEKLATQALKDLETKDLSVKNYNFLMKQINEKYKNITGDSIASFLDKKGSSAQSESNDSLVGTDIGHHSDLVQKLESFPEGSQIVTNHSSGGKNILWVKTPGGKWINNGISTPVSSKLLASANHDSVVVKSIGPDNNGGGGIGPDHTPSAPTSGLSIGQDIKGADIQGQMDSLPVGSQLEGKFFNTGDELTFTKEPNGEWSWTNLNGGHSQSESHGFAVTKWDHLKISKIGDNSVPTPAPATAESSPSAPNASVPGEIKTYDISGWTKGKAMGGSNGATLYTAPDGSKYIVKPVSGPNFTPSQHAADMEALASVMYNTLGQQAPEIGFTTLNGKPAVVSTFTDHTPLGHLSGQALADAKQKLYDNYAIDTWLANYDLIGLGKENVGVDAQGNLVYIDNGGAFDVKAQGDTKQWWGNDPTDFNMWSSGKNPSASQAWSATIPFYKDITPEQKNESAKKLQQISDQDIHSMIDKIPTMSSAQKAKLAETMIARRDGILKLAGLEKPSNVTAKIAGEPGLPKIGDKVIYTQGNGLVKQGTVIGFTPDGAMKVKSSSALDKNGNPATHTIGANNISKWKVDNSSVLDSAVPGPPKPDGQPLTTATDFVIHQAPDPSSPWFGEDKKPVIPSSKVIAGNWVSDDLYAKLEQRYQEFKKSKGEEPTTLKASGDWSNYLGYILEQGSLSHLETLHNKGRIDDDLYQEVKQSLEAKHASESSALLDSQANHAKYNNDLVAWSLANGYPVLRLPTESQMSNVPKKDTQTSVSWWKAHLAGVSFTTKEKEGIYHQKSTSSWASIIRGLAKKHSLNKEELRAKLSSGSQNVFDGITSAAAKGKIPDGELGAYMVREIGPNSFHDLTGSPMTAASDFTQLVGSMQFDFGAAEGTVGNAQAGVTSLLSQGNIRMNMHLLPGVEVTYAPLSGGTNHTGEKGAILSPGSGYIITSATKNPYGGWTLEVTVIPQSLYGSFNYFSGEGYDIPVLKGNLSDLGLGN